MRQPSKFGKYLLLDRIAVGGMAEVFVAKAFGVEGFERLLAIKKILPTMGEDQEFISMFVDEARIAVQLSHANIVQVLELGKHEENLYIAMEYISGRDVRQLLERFRKRGRPMPTPQACLIVAKVCEALDYAHRKRDPRGVPLGIVHRDVSPQNVLVSFEGEVKLIDFGIAKAESRLQRTQAGILKGKFSYMSPEQVRGQPVDSRSDIFAVGVLLWELLCGEKLFTGDSDFVVLEKVRNGLVPSPRSVNPELSEALEWVMLKALATEVADRYQHARELHDELMRFTLLGDTVYGSRQLAEWIREDFAADYEKEQGRLRGWLSVEEESAEVTPIEAMHAHPAEGAGWQIATRPALPAPPLPSFSQSPYQPLRHELPTQEWQLPVEADTLVQQPTPSGQAATPPRGSARPPPGLLFGNSEETTDAPRAQRRSALIKPLCDQAPPALRLIWVPVAGAVLFGLWFVLARPDQSRAGRVVITLSSPGAGELFIDGKSAGQVPPFDHAVPVGEHKLEVRAEGYQVFSTAIAVPSGDRPLEVEAQLVGDGLMQMEEKPDRSRRKWLVGSKKNAPIVEQPKPKEPPHPTQEPRPSEIELVEKQPRLRRL